MFIDTAYAYLNSDVLLDSLALNIQLSEFRKNEDQKMMFTPSNSSC